jgi:hypothetical protein
LEEPNLESLYVLAFIGGGGPNLLDLISENSGVSSYLLAPMLFLLFS